MRSYDVIVVGGGIIGGAIAFRLAQESLRVALLERGEPGREASWAAAGMLSPAPDSSDAIPLVPFGRASLRLYPDFLAALEHSSGLPARCRREGAIELLFSSGSERELSTLIALHRGLGLPTEPLPLDEARRLEPAVSREARAAALLPYECSVDNRALTRAAMVAAQSAGAELRAGAEVTQILHEGNRCTGVVAGRETCGAGHVVLAAGAFSGALSIAAAGIDLAVPVRPIRGQMVALRAGAPTPRITRTLRSERGYIVPRDDADPQLLIAGSTLEDAGFDKRVTPRGLEQILSAVQELAPSLAGAEIMETWSGLRPDTPDHLPLLGPTELENLTLATGHYRNGILLAPITAKLIREWVVDKRVSMDWGIFSPLRFAGARAAKNN